MAAKSGLPFWLRLVFIVIGFFLFVKLVAQDLLPYVGEKREGVSVSIKQVEYFDKDGKVKGKGVRKTKWHYSWKFKVNGNEYSGKTESEDKIKKIGNTATVYYLGSFPWLNTIDTGTVFGLSSLAGILLGGFFMFLGFHRSKSEQDVVTAPKTINRPVVEHKPAAAKTIEKPTPQPKPEKIQTPASVPVEPQIQQPNNPVPNNNAKINFCPNCGSKIFGGANFCANCGKKIA